jgi:hypothetical protein
VSLTIVTEREVDEGKLFPNGKPKNLDLKVVSSHKIVSDQLVDKLFSEDTLDGAVVKDGRVRIIFAGFGRLGQYVYSRLARECEARELVLEAHAFDHKIGDIEGPLAVRMDCRDDARLSKTRCDVNSVAFFDEVIRLSGDVERQGDLDAVIVCLGSDDASARCAQNVAQLAERTESTTAVFAQQVQGHNLDFAKDVLGYDPFGAARLIYTEANLL